MFSGYKFQRQVIVMQIWAEDISSVIILYPDGLKYGSIVTLPDHLCTSVTQ